MASSEQFVIRLGVNSNGVTAGVNSAVGQIDHLYHSVKKAVEWFIALEAVRFGVEQIKSVIEMGAQLNNLADRSNMAVETLQEFQFGIKEAGGDLDGLVRGIKEISRAQIDALKGNAELRAAFARYGVTLADLRSKNPTDLFKQVAQGIGNATATAQVTDDVAQIFGKIGDSLLPAFRNGLIESSEEARKLGLVLNREVTDELQRAHKELEILTEKWKAFLAIGTASAFKSIREFFRDSVDLIAAATIAKAAEKAGGGTEIAKLIGNILGRGVLANESAKEKAEEEERKAKQEKRNQAAPGDVQKAGATHQTPNKIDSDALSKFGGYRGGVGEVNRVFSLQLEAQREGNRILAKIAQKRADNAVDAEVQNLTRALREFRGALMEAE